MLVRNASAIMDLELGAEVIFQPCNAELNLEFLDAKKPEMRLLI